mmetsp:Transcript_23031/g.67847  ORF Transcript_23031/g.67847 Transcript_23031/m.67847 type:complete len:250 (+) Transcript_23031:484-1233(+)
MKSRRPMLRCGARASALIEAHNSAVGVDLPAELFATELSTIATRGATTNAATMPLTTSAPSMSIVGLSTSPSACQSFNMPAAPRTHAPTICSGLRPKGSEAGCARVANTGRSGSLGMFGSTGTTTPRAPDACAIAPLEGSEVAICPLVGMGAFAPVNASIASGDMTVGPVTGIAIAGMASAATPAAAPVSTLVARLRAPRENLLSRALPDCRAAGLRRARGVMRIEMTTAGTSARQMSAWRDRMPRRAV